MSSLSVSEWGCVMGDWYCPTCDEYLSGSRVTFSEHCDTCQTPVTVPEEGLVEQLRLLKEKWLNAESALNQISAQSCEGKIRLFMREVQFPDKDFTHEDSAKFWCECPICVAGDGLEPTGADEKSWFREDAT